MGVGDMEKIPSTKFLTVLFGMLFVTVVECWLLFLDNTEYVTHYIILMGSVMGVQNVAKTIQNAVYDGNGGK
jgi:hypothetical protein